MHIHFENANTTSQGNGAVGQALTEGPFDGIRGPFLFPSGMAAFLQGIASLQGCMSHACACRVIITLRTQRVLPVPHQKRKSSGLFSTFAFLHKREPECFTSES